MIWLYTLRYHSIGFDRFFLACDLSACCVYPVCVSFHASKPPFVKCNNLRDHCNPYKLPDLWLPNSPDLNPIDYKIWVIIHQRVLSTKVQDVKYTWAGMEESIIQNVIDHRCRHLHTCIQPQKDITNIIVTKISMNIKIKLKFTVKQDTSFRLSLLS